LKKLNSILTRITSFDLMTIQGIDTIDELS